MFKTNKNIRGVLMIEQDTIKLLRECDAGIKMGVDSINDVLDDVKNEDFKSLLKECRDKHEKLGDELRELLKDYHDDGKDPNPAAKSMSWLKTFAKLAADKSDKTIADLMTDGCNMGVKSINRYLNQYAAADEKSKKIAERLSSLEEELCVSIRKYL